jgi:hypothetical protein
VRADDDGTAGDDALAHSADESAILGRGRVANRIGTLTIVAPSSTTAARTSHR